MTRIVCKHRCYVRGRLSEDNMEGRVRRRKGQGMRTSTHADVWKHADLPWPYSHYFPKISAVSIAAVVQRQTIRK